MTYKDEKKSMILFIKLFMVLFVILFIMPELLDELLNMFLPYRQPNGNTILVLKPIYEDMAFSHRFLLILKNIIIYL